MIDEAALVALEAEGYTIQREGRKRSPYKRGTLIDVVYRNGNRKEGTESGGPYAETWEHTNCNGDIMAHRLHPDEPTGTGAA